MGVYYPVPGSLPLFCQTLSHYDLFYEIFPLPSVPGSINA